MKPNRGLLLVTSLICALTLSAQSMRTTDKGVYISLKPMDIECRFFGPDVVQILKTPVNRPSIRKSLTITQLPQRPDIQTKETSAYFQIQTSGLQLIVDKTTGTITFNNKEGKRLINERPNTTLVSLNDYTTDTTFQVRQAFVLAKDEAIYGLGQHQNGKLNLRNQRIRLRQDNMKICIPYFLSNKGYALYWDNYSPTVFADNVNETQFDSEVGECVDYYVMTGPDLPTVAARMRTLTGKAPLPPLWSLGFFQSKERYRTQEEPVEVVKRYRDLKIPLDVVIQDWQYWGNDSNWNAMRFDNPAFNQPQAMIDQVHAQNARMLISVWASFGPKTLQYAEMKPKGMLLDIDTWPRNQGVMPYDPFNPAARDIYWKHLNENIFALGMDGWWLDSTEPDHFNMGQKEYNQNCHLGTFRGYCNAFPLMTTGGVYDHQRAVTSDKRVVILTRSAFAGQQRYGTFVWSGDVTSSWENLANQIPAALNLSLCGIPYWNSDIGGFFSNRYFRGGVNNKTFHELYVRWMQFAAFTPMMRSHGTDTPREIYQFGQPGDWSFDAQARMLKLRYRLLPYLYATAWQVTNQDASFMRPLIFDYPDDKALLNLTDQYLFGSSLMVAPVLNAQYVKAADNTYTETFDQPGSRQVYLPANSRWIDFWTGETLEGGQTVTKATPIDLIPLYVKAGSIIPWGPDVQYATEKNWKTLEIRIYPGADGQFTLYEDENDSYNYEKGAHSTITFNWNEATRTLTLSHREGKFKGMHKKRHFNIVLVQPSSNPADAGATSIAQTITYKGKTKTVVL